MIVVINFIKEKKKYRKFIIFTIIIKSLTLKLLNLMLIFLLAKILLYHTLKRLLFICAKIKY